MTVYATHRFSVGQRVMRASEACEVIARLKGPHGPEYRVRSGRSETVVGERELTYLIGPGSVASARPAFMVH